MKKRKVTSGSLLPRRLPVFGKNNGCNLLKSAAKIYDATFSSAASQISMIDTSKCGECRRCFHE